MKTLQWIYCLAGLLTCTPAPAQDPVCRTINHLNGLPSNTVYYIQQDSAGFIWLAHDRGLSRYDGKEFKQYQAVSQTGRSLSNLLQVGNSIWCQDFSGNFYYTKGDSLLLQPKMKTPGTFIAAGLLGHHTLISCKPDSIRQYQVPQNKYTALAINQGIMPAQTAAGDSMFYMIPGALMLFNNGSFQSLQTWAGPTPQFFFLVKNSFGVAALTRDQYPYLYFIGSKGPQPQPLLPPGIFIQDVCKIDDEIWISTSAGAWCFTAAWQPKYNGHCFYAGSSITRILKDREGSYWFGTLNNGIRVVPNINALLYPYRNEGITALAASHEQPTLFAGTTANAVLEFNPATRNFSIRHQWPGTQEVLHIYPGRPGEPMIISSEKTRILRRQNLRKFLTLGIKMVCRFNNDFYAAAFSSGYGLLPVVENSSARPPAWLGATPINHQQFYRINQKDTRGRWVCYTGKDSTLYAAAADGLHYYNPGGSGTVQYQGADIYAAQLVTDGAAVYAATFSAGLFRVSGTQAIPITGKNKPVLRTIYRICKNENFIWAAGDALLQKIDLATGAVIEYTYADGLPRAELKDLLVQNGTVYAATTQGMVVLAANAASENNTPPLLALNQVTVNDRPVDLNSNRRFAAGQNNISIHFSALAFKAEELVQVQYKINNGSWSLLNNGARVINLSALSPGRYTVTIQAFNEDQVASARPIVLRFAIAQPFYKTGWFIGLLLLSAMALVYFYFRTQLHNEKRNAALLRQKITLEQELHQSMLASIKSQMNPHFLFNALNTIQAYIYTNEKENASLYLGKFSELTRMILDMSNREQVSLADEIRALHLYLELEQLRFEDKLHYTFSVDDRISTETTHIPAMLIQPYIENAIKHGLMHYRGAWQLQISFVLNGPVIEVTVDDNGVGRKASAAINAQRNRRHQSFAAGANQKRLEILNKGLRTPIVLEITDKEDAHGHALGTRVTLRIPVSGR